MARRVLFRNRTFPLTKPLLTVVEAVDANPDIFKTITNVTGDMSAAAMLSRT
jgi:Na+/H+-dicarboxylate symporter